MMKILIGILLAVLCSGCNEKKESRADNKMPTSQEVTEMKAKEDYQAVIDGKIPVHAARDESKPDLADGGTTFYKGEGYSLEVQKRVSEKDGKSGYMYGPKIVFLGASSELSDVRFYTKDELDKKISSK